MFGYSRNSGIHWCRDYGDAFHKYQSTTDIRGRVKEPKRPLGQRRSVDMYSIRLRDDGSMGVECVLYKTPVVTFFPTGLVELRSDGWASASTVSFIEEVTGYRSRIFNGSLCVSVGGIETRLEDNQVLQIMDGRIINPTTDKTHKVNRANANNVRKQYEEFVKYATALVRLKAGQFTLEEVENAGFKESLSELGRAHYTKFPESVRNLFALVKADGEDKHVAHYQATVAISRAFGAVSWGRGYSVNGCHIEEKVFKTKFDDLVLGYHRDEVFIETDREEGVVKKDPYRKYYEGGWKRLHSSENLT